MKRVGGGFRWAAIVALGYLASGCMQTASLFSPPEPAVTAPAVTEPAPVAAPKADKLPVNVAPKTNSEAAKPADPVAVKAVTPDPAPMAPAPAKVVTPAVVPTPDATAPKATGTAPAAATATAPAEPLPLDAPAPVAVPKTDDTGFPNINAPPAQPEGTLLPPDERKRIIDELEALRDRQNAAKPPQPADSADADLKEQAATQGDAAIKQIEKCSAAGAENDPDCQLLPTQ